MLTAISLAAMMLAVCLLLHVVGLLVMVEWLIKHPEYRERKGTMTRYASLLLLLFSGIMCLHLTEAILWAAFYYTWALFNNFETSLYFSLTSYSTIGYGDVLLPQRWRLLGAVEGVSGVLLCGISTAFIFTVISALLQIRLQQQTALSEVTVTPAP